MGQRTFILLKKNYKNNNGEWASRVSLIHHQWGYGRVMLALLMQEILKTQYNMDRSMSYIYSDTEPMPNDDGYLIQPISMFYNFSPLSNPRDNYSFRETNAKDLGLKKLELFDETKPRTVRYYGIDGKTLQQEEVDEPTVLFDFPMDYNYDIFDINNIREYYNLTDNNNGCMVVEVTQQYNKNGNVEGIISQAFKLKIGFCIGSEEEDFYHEAIQSEHSYPVYNPEFTTVVSPDFYVAETWNTKEAKAFVKSFKVIVGQLVDIEYVYDKTREKELVELKKKLTGICEALKEKGFIAPEIVKELKKVVGTKEMCYK